VARGGFIAPVLHPAPQWRKAVSSQLRNSYRVSQKEMKRTLQFALFAFIGVILGLIIAPFAIYGILEFIMRNEPRGGFNANGIYAIAYGGVLGSSAGLIAGIIAFIHWKRPRS
jgi:hypothetical protein